MAYADIYNAAIDAAIFQPRCLVAVWKAAQDVVNEPINTVNHDQRLPWALNTLRGQAKITPMQLTMQVLRNPTIAANPGVATDADIQFQVNSIIDELVRIG